MRLPINGFTALMLGAIVLASVVPVQGEAAEALAVIGSVAVGLLFFFHGAALSRQQIIAGASHWRLHIVITSMTFVAFPLLVLPVTLVPESWMPGDLALGFIYLGVLPSAVTSSIAFTAMAKGNVPAAICSAAASNVFGMMLTPFLLLLLAQTTGAGFDVAGALQDIVVQLLLPFFAGHAIRPWVMQLIDRYKPVLAKYDQGVILLIVYSAFSHSVVSGLWQKLPIGSVMLTIALCFLLLFVVILLTRLVVRTMGLDAADEAAVVFCGSKKSLASGLPMAKVLFAGHPGFGMIVLPIMCYNQIQIFVGAFLARYYGRRIVEETERVRDA